MPFMTVDFIIHHPDTFISLCPEYFKTSYFRLQSLSSLAVFEFMSFVKSVYQKCLFMFLVHTYCIVLQ